MAQTEQQNRGSDNKIPILIEIKTWYNKYFPTDRKTYEIRFPVIGLILSISSIQIFKNLIAQRDDISFITLSYIILSIGLAMMLYYGLHIGDSKQFTPWIIFKVIEITTTLTTMICIICTNPRHSYSITLVVFGFVISALSICHVAFLIDSILKNRSNNNISTEEAKISYEYPYNERPSFNGGHPNIYNGN